MNNENLTLLLRVLGFRSVDEFKRYMKRMAKPQKYSPEERCYNEERHGYTLNYSTNCKSVYGIGAVVRGVWQDFRFN